MEKTLAAWWKQLDDWVFPLRVDLLLAIAEGLAQQRAGEE
jgi:hypothetical protein